MGMVKNLCGQSSQGTLILTVHVESIDGIIHFLHGSTNSGKLKKIPQWFLDGQSLVHEALKSAVS